MQATTFLMFTGQAEEAARLYTSVFPGARFTVHERYGAGGPEGTVKHGVLELGGTRLRFFDSPVPHAFTFNPAISIFVDMDDEATQQRAFEALSRDGQVLMPLDAYDFSRRFAWVQDRFGVSWQLNLP